MVLPRAELNRIPGDIVTWGAAADGFVPKFTLVRRTSRSAHGPCIFVYNIVRRRSQGIYFRAEMMNLMEKISLRYNILQTSRYNNIITI